MQEISYNDYLDFEKKMTSINVEVMGLRACGTDQPPLAEIGDVEEDQHTWMNKMVDHDANKKIPGVVAVKDLINDGGTHQPSGWLEIQQVISWINNQRGPNDQVSANI